jgi:hypothetical protein
MASRLVTSARWNAQGYISFVGNEGEPWSPRPVREVLLDIELGAHEYHVQIDGRHAEIDSAADAGGMHLHADTDGSGRNCMLDLPGC